MQITFSFDTEDYVDPVSNDALLAMRADHPSLPTWQVLEMIQDPNAGWR